MNASQMRWAASHDWYRGASLESGSYSVMVMDLVDQLIFTNFNELSAWAGY